MIIKLIRKFIKPSFKKERHLALMRDRYWGQRSNSIQKFLNYSVRICDGPSFYMQYKDEFINQIYHFDAVREDPLIIDGGSNIGMSILYFKHVYPKCKVIGFEPDPEIFKLLEQNVRQNGLSDVALVNTGLGAEAGNTAFIHDGSDGGKFGKAENSFTITVEPLSTYLAEPVDFLKLNIEGQELPVLLEIEQSGRLRNVREIIVEYHGWAYGEQKLGDILHLLDRNKFRYMIHDFDAETCGITKPPFKYIPDATWFCLVYARRTD